MTLLMVPVGSSFNFKGYPGEICRVVERGHGSVKVEEKGETSWYKSDREVIYPVVGQLDIFEPLVRDAGSLDPTYWKKFAKNI